MIKFKNILCVFAGVATIGAALAGVQTYNSMNLPRPAMKSELIEATALIKSDLVEVEEELTEVAEVGLETKQMMLEEAIDRRQLQMYRNQRVQQGYSLDEKPVPEFLQLEEHLLQKTIEKREEQLEKVKTERMK